jgi:hypothetical protein
LLIEDAVTSAGLGFVTGIFQGLFPNECIPMKIFTSRYVPIPVNVDEDGTRKEPRMTARLMPVMRIVVELHPSPKSPPHSR